MKQFQLEGRDVGYFMHFERELLRPGVHKGWVRLGPNRYFQLVYNPWMQSWPGRHLYRLPEGISLSQGQFVELEVGRKVTQIQNLQARSNLAGKYSIIYPVEKITILNPPVHKPQEMTAKDFLARICGDWVGAEHDFLDLSVALQVLSCPPESVPVGGLGSQSYNLGRTKKPLTALKDTIRMSLPKEFFSPNESFYFDIIDNDGRGRAFESGYRPQIVSEISYNYITNVMKLSGKPLRINIPTIIQNAKMKKNSFGPDYEVIDYALSAHMVQPVIPSSMTKRLKKHIKEFRDEVAPLYRGFNIEIDPHSTLRIAMAMCRLHFRCELDETTLMRGWKDVASLFKDYLYYLENEFKGEECAYKEPTAYTSEKENYPKNDLIMHNAIVDMYDASKGWISIEELRTKMKNKIKDDVFEKSLNNNHNRGWIILSPDLLSIQPVE